MGWADGIFEKNEDQARKFWAKVARGGAPSLKRTSRPQCLTPSSSRLLRKSGNWTSARPTSTTAGIYAWNASREGKTINSVKYDTKKGLYTVAA
jgi:hypothetical protein